MKYNSLKTIYPSKCAIIYFYIRYTVSLRLLNDYLRLYYVFFYAFPNKARWQYIWDVDIITSSGAAVLVTKLFGNKSNHLQSVPNGISPPVSLRDGNIKATTIQKECHNSPFFYFWFCALPPFHKSTTFSSEAHNHNLNTLLKLSSKTHVVGKLASLG